MTASLPKAIVYNRQRAVRLDLARLSAFAQKAADACDREAPPPGILPPADPVQVEISLVSDRRMAALHWQFLQVRGTTDVLTFAHGEIVISAQVAARAAREHGQPLERELCRYIVHGLLHLRGFEDDSPAARSALWRRQEAILSVLAVPATRQDSPG